MEFGSQQVFDYIKYNLSNAKNELWYDRLYAVVKGDVMGILSAYKLQKSDKDDIVQEVKLSVTLHLVQFVCDSEYKTKEQRNAWLRTIAKRKVMDFFRKKYKSLEDSIEDVTLNLEKEKKYLSCDDIEKKLKENATETKLVRALSVLFSINTSPEKIIAFVFNRIIGTTENSRKNGSPKEITDKFNGIEIQNMFEIMKQELQGLVSFEIPSSVYLPLIKKIEHATEQGKVKILFTLSPRGITDSSNWITKKIREKEEDK